MMQKDALTLIRTPISTSTIQNSISKEKKLEEALQLQPGDIIICEMPYVDAEEKDMFPFSTLDDFIPGHSILWVGSDRPLAHAVREGYKLPGLRMSGLMDAKYVVFRPRDIALGVTSASIMRAWATSSKLYSKEQYLKTYPKKFWLERHQKDLDNFYQLEEASIPGPATPYLEPRATNDQSDYARNPKILQMGEDGLRRAIKFASRRETISPEPMSKGTRCTPVVIATYQAAILAPIIKPRKKQELHFKAFKDRSFLEYAPDVLIEGWEKTEVGERLLKSYNSNDYTQLFPKPFAVDSRYANINIFFEALKESEHFEIVGLASILKQRIEITPFLEETVPNKSSLEISIF